MRDKELTFKYLADEREVKALEELLPLWQQYKGEDGTYPFKDWDLTNLFQAIVMAGSKYIISEQIKKDQFLHKLIDVDELFNGKEFRLKEEREKEGSDEGIGEGTERGL